MQHVFQCFIKLIEVSTPDNMEIYWETSSFNLAPWACLHRPYAEEDVWRPALPGPEQRWRSLELANGQRLFLCDPFPLIWQKEWIFLPVRCVFA